MKRITLLVLFLITFILITWKVAPTYLRYSAKPSSENTAAEMFAAVMQVKEKPSMKLQGIGDTWQGYNLYLRFKTNQEVQISILTQGYKETTCNKHDFIMPNRHYDIFKNPSWGDLKLENGACFMLNGAKNNWTHFGTHHLHVNPKTGIIHVHAIGS